MRKAALALVSVIALAACNPSAPAGDSAAGGAFPNIANAAYRAEATITGEDGSTIPVVMVRDGQKLRMELSTAQGAMVVITNPDTGEDYVITNAGGQQMAMRMTQMGAPVKDPAAEWSGEMAENATRTGSCSVAGESGAEWTRTDEGSEPNTACVTNDGIILRATEGGRTVWETTSVSRGAQPADQFALPPGVQVVDLGDMGAAMQGALERAQSGAGE